MKTIILLIILGIPSVKLHSDDLNSFDGVYTMCKDVSGYSSETIELSHGKFRYWFYSDIPTGRVFPIAGTFQVHEDTITLENSEITFPDRTRAVIDGHIVLFRKDGLDEWRLSRKILPYATLIKIPDTTVENIGQVNRPDITSIGGTIEKK
jgi:hypothetical protein